MTHIAPDTSTNIGPEVVIRSGVAPVPRQASGLLLAWSISRSAAKACGLVTGESGPSVRLEVCIGAPANQSASSLEARVLDGDRASPLATPQARGTWIQDSIRGVWHLDIEGLLKLTIRRTEGLIEALYARTELLSRAGIAGGRYEFEGASLVRGDPQG